jgi:hypothetical protein
MNDPRLDETHLNPLRREQYRFAREGVYGAMGPTTGDVEQEFHANRLPIGHVPGPASYALMNVRSGRMYLLRVGINTIGRYPNNDIVFPEIYVSRRHCVILIHSSGKFEVRDTASRHGIRFGHRPVEQVELAPGDILRVCDYKLLFLAEPSRGVR